MLGRLQRFVASQTFFWLVMCFFVVSAAWVALSSLYPMAFDEEFHFGLIKIYAEHWNPFIHLQTPERDVFGSITTDPSYLFHYLMSFPYRLTAAVTHNEAAIVIVLRLINVAFFAWGLVLFRKVLLEARVRPAIINSVFMVFVLIPVVPLLAGQINYDNLLMPLVAATFLLAQRIRNSLRTHGELPLNPVYWLLVLFLLGAIIKYAFLPIAAGVTFYLLYELYRAHRTHRKVFYNIWRQAARTQRAYQVAGVLMLLLAGLLFSQRYVLNVVKYHDIVPDCAAVVSENRCMAYGPWGRDYRYSLAKGDVETKGIVQYVAQDWSWGMWQRLYFTLAGPTNGYDTKKPLPIGALSVIVLSAGGVVLLLLYGRRIFRRYPIFVAVYIASGVYLAALILQEYSAYVHTAQPVAINGRYLLPLLPLAGVPFALAYAQFFQKFSPKIAPIFVVAVLLLLLQGGGPITYIVRGQSNWYWDNSFVRNTNNTLQALLKPVVYERYFLTR